MHLELSAGAHGAWLDRIYDLLSVSIPELIMQSISQPDQRIPYRSIIAWPDLAGCSIAWLIWLADRLHDRSVCDSLIWLADRLHDRFRKASRQQIVDPTHTTPHEPWQRALDA